MVSVNVCEDGSCFVSKATNAAVVAGLLHQSHLVSEKTDAAVVCRATAVAAV
eukprot:CAMPEP_0168256474 /NCGR_PEP_ID=MMETSP0141_2-20121125/5895_1 /TAXON_ID=44445 /ORGANISM="Pseudo-nitzschia australis, Strain 10249 10 AB" /LENGTH=51 /DNA_ID=CAMNT_0008193219 /DNA_START=335 /DNA_END=486 /DNA_ORIENTATION=+